MYAVGTGKSKSCIPANLLFNLALAISVLSPRNVVLLEPIIKSALLKTQKRCSIVLELPAFKSLVGLSLRWTRKPYRNLTTMQKIQSFLSSTVISSIDGFTD